MTTRVAELDLSRPMAPLRTAGSGSVRILVRHGRDPLGWIAIAEAGEIVPVEQLRTALLQQAGRALGETALRRRLAGDGPRTAGEQATPFSVIVCTRDRTESLRCCLESLRALAHTAFEVVVVDNAPTTTGTAELAASMAPSFAAPRALRYVREDRPGLDWARNRGIAESVHALVAFTDDDVRVDPAWLDALGDAFADPDVALVTGYVAPAELDSPARLEFEDGYGGMGKGFRPRRWQGDALHPHDMLGAHHLGVGANMAFRRALLERVGGFDTALDVGTPSHGAGDLEMFHRVLASGAVAQYEPSALVWHSHRCDGDALRRQLRDNGRAFGTYLIGCFVRRTVPRLLVASYAARVWMGWLVGSIARSLVGRDRMPVGSRVVELWGAAQAPWAYWRTRRSDERIRRVRAPD